MNNLNKDGLKFLINCLSSIKEAVIDSDAIVIIQNWKNLKKSNGMKFIL